ncbi:MAG: helix-turn-helix domain-containing protein [Firmicutes bacterium]|jgi:putative transcriptional regulator|nr:helix-turn-helix domain-containing protein [Bacillota bacterium]
MLKYKIDVMETLKEAGYNTTRIRKEKLISEGGLQSIREGKVVGAKILDTLCTLLDMQPGNIIKYVENPETKKTRKNV